MPADRMLRVRVTVGPDFVEVEGDVEFVTGATAAFYAIVTARSKALEAAQRVAAMRAQFQRENDRIDSVARLGEHLRRVIREQLHTADAR